MCYAICSCAWTTETAVKNNDTIYAKDKDTTIMAKKKSDKWMHSEAKALLQDDNVDGDVDVEMAPMHVECNENMLLSNMKICEPDSRAPLPCCHNEQ